MRREVLAHAIPLVFPAPWRGLTVRSYRDGDLAAIRPLPAFKREMKTAPEFPGGMAWTILRDGVVVAIAGAEEQRGRVWRVWACLARMTRREWAYATRCTRAVLDHLQSSLEAKQIAAVVRPRHKTGRAYLARLGFRPAAKIRNYTIMERG